MARFTRLCAAGSPAGKRSFGSVDALLAAVLGLGFVHATPLFAERNDRIDASRREVSPPAPIRLTGVAAGDAIAADDNAPDLRCRVVCAL